MNKEDWLLMTIDSYIEPIQLQKTLFRFAKEARAPVRQRYSFVPYNWGPCSRDIYQDLEQLRQKGLVEFVPTGRGWNAYRLTTTGEERAGELRRKANASLLRRLRAARKWVTERPFNTLLRDVYSRYPRYATKSLFEG
jgi:uncharacterized protein YwgA